MNKILLGNDIVEISRIAKLGVEELGLRILSKEELNELNTITDNKRRLQFLAGRYAFKEAYFKATPNKDFKYSSLSVILKDDKLQVSLNDKVLDNVSVSISHDGGYALATVVILNK